MKKISEGNEVINGGLCARSRIRTVGIVLMAFSMAFVSLGPVPAIAGDFSLVRVGSYNTHQPVRVLDISHDGQWIVAGGSDSGVTQGGVYLFPHGQYSPSWSSTRFWPFSDTKFGIRGNSHPIAMTENGSYFSVAAAPGSAASNECHGPGVNGCLFLFQRQGRNAILLWQRNYTDYTQATDIASVSARFQPVVVAEMDELYVYNLDGTAYWHAVADGYIHNVRISRNGDYMAVGGSGSRGYVSFYNKSTTGYYHLWTYFSGNGSTMMNIDMDDDGYLLAAGEDYAFFNPSHPTNLTQFAPGPNGWSPSNGTPCTTYTKPNDIYGVAVSRNATVNVTGHPFRVVVGKSGPLNIPPNQDKAQQFPFCTSTPVNEWDLGSPYNNNVTLSVDASVSGCNPQTYCFSVFGSSDGGVHIAREGDARVRSDYAGGPVNAVIMSPQLSPSLAAGSEDGYVYFYEIAISTP